MHTITTTPIEASADAAPAPAPAARWALAGLSLSMLLSSLGTSVANVALPTLARSFHAPFQAVQWVVLAYLLAVTSLIVGAGRLGDLLGRRRLLLAGLALFTGASVLCGVAPSLAVLVAARAAQGLGGAVIMALTMAFVGDVVPAARVGSAMGLLGTMSAVGTALGPTLGGALLGGPGWRALFLVNVPLGLVALLLARRHLSADRSTPAADRAGFDAAGTALLALTLGAYALAMTVGRGRFGAVNVALLGGTAVGVALFALVERRTRSPLVRLSMLGEGALGARLAANTLVSTVMMATLVVGPFYLARTLGLAPALVGLAMSVGPLVTAVAGVPSGRLSDRAGARRTALLGLATMLVGAALLAALPSTLGVVGYVGAMAVLTGGYAFFQTANNAAVMAGADAAQRGVVAGVLSLSRNLGLVTGASLMGAVFSRASGAVDVASAAPGAVAIGMHVTFAVAAALVVGALALVVAPQARRAAALAAAGVALGATSVQSQSAAGAPERVSVPAPEDPYPLAAAGWGPAAERGLFVSRWAEDWSRVRAAGGAPPLKAQPLWTGVSVTVSAEARARYDGFANARLAADDDYRQAHLRGALGVDLRAGRWLRAYGELATGQVAGRRDGAGPNVRNDLSLQQLFGEARGRVGGALVGAMVGRQEFADGPRQLVSVSDGPNLHRTWNGVRLYAHSGRARLGLFDLRVTRLALHGFDERIDDAERMRGANASVLVVRGERGGNVYLDPFWMRTERPGVRSADATGVDERDTFGARLWGRRGRVAFDWTAARQVGRFAERDVRAWGAFAVQSLTLSEGSWRPRLTGRVDLASGGDGGAGTRMRRFNPLYASSGYVGEGQFLSLSNVLLVAPGVSVAPSARGTVSLEYGVARRMDERDAAYAGGMRAYARTRDVRGRDVGRLLRVTGTRAVASHLTLFLDLEHLAAGDVLRRAGLPAGEYGHVGATFRY